MYRAKIIRNLEGHDGKWVNTFCTLRGLSGVEYKEELTLLIEEGIVEKQIQIIRPSFGDTPDLIGDLYRINPFRTDKKMGEKKLKLVE